MSQLDDLFASLDLSSLLGNPPKPAPTKARLPNEPRRFSTRSSITNLTPPRLHAERRGPDSYSPSTQQIIDQEHKCTLKALDELHRFQLFHQYHTRFLFNILGA